MYVRKNENDIREAVAKKRRDLRNPLKPLAIATACFIFFPLLYALGIRGTRSTVIIVSSSRSFGETVLHILPVMAIACIGIFIFFYRLRLARVPDPFQKEDFRHCLTCDQGRTRTDNRCTTCGGTEMEPAEFYDWVEEPPAE